MKPVPPSAVAGRRRPTTPSAGRLGLPAVLLKADTRIGCQPEPEPEQCQACRAYVYEAEDSDAFCDRRWCEFRRRARKKK